MVFLIQPRVVPADVKFLPSNMPLKTAYITTVNVHLMCTYCEVSVKKILADKTRKSRYRYDNRAMRPICECPENCRPIYM